MSNGEDGGPCIKWRKKEDRRRSQKKAEELGVSEGKEEEYWSEGEDGRPCIKWRERKTGWELRKKFRTQEETEKIIKYCTWQREKERSTCLRGKMGDPVSSGEGK